MPNIDTAMGQAYADTIPMLVVSNRGRRADLGTGNGYLQRPRLLKLPCIAADQTMISVQGNE